MVRKGAGIGNPAAVQAPASLSTYVGGLGTLTAGIIAIVTGLVRVFGLSSHPTTAQASVIDGAFFLSAVAVIGFAWVVISDFRSRAMTHSASLTGGAAHAQVPVAHAAAGGQQAGGSGLFRVKVIESGDVYKVLSVQKDGAGAGHDLFLINHATGDKHFQWISASEVEFEGE